MQVTQVYLDVLKTQRLKQLADDNLTAHETVYQQIKLRTDSGLGTLSDLSQIRGRVARAQANVLSASNNLIEEVDIYEAVNNLETSKVALQAAQQSFVKIQNLSLFNYL